ncbi:MAG: DHH family phosphoesterase [Deltaproteobacteria bacterium]|nr:DHH family phosphoesterase [Deltaproteobacteria bacterium]
MSEPAPEPPFDLDQALGTLGTRSRALILPHDNPDPDAMAAAFALGALLRHARGIDSVVAYGGYVGRAENRAMVRALHLPLTPIDEVDLGDFPIIALVDTQPETGNNSLPPGHRIDIVVDHHPPRSASARAPWCDVREGMGASSTITYKYLVEKQVPLDSSLATALFYALKSETRDLGRESTSNEAEAYADLVLQADHKLMYEITHPRVRREHFVAQSRALRAAMMLGPLMVVNLGELDYPDLVAEIADLMLRYESAHWVVVMGRFHGRAYLSLRTDIEDGGAGHLMRRVVGAKGAAGGHGMIAGGRMFQRVEDDDTLNSVFDDVVDRFVKELAITDAQPRSLLQPGDA